MNDLLSLVLELQPPPLPEDADLPPWWGRAAHALAFRVMAETSPDLAQRWHDDPSAPRPFTVSTLWGGDLRAGEPVTLRLTALQVGVAELFQAAAGRGPLAPGRQVELDGLGFTVRQAVAAEEAHPWAQTASWEALISRWLTGRVANPPRAIRLILVSPTTFKKDGRHLPLPLPELVFGSLLARWNAFAPVALPVETRRYAAECLVLTAYRLRTRRVTLRPGQTRIGAVGQVTFRTTNYDRYWMSLLHALTDFAFFAGLGAGVTMGLGQARRP